MDDRPIPGSGRDYFPRKKRPAWAVYSARAVILAALYAAVVVLGHVVFETSWLISLLSPAFAVLAGLGLIGLVTLAGSEPI